MWNHLLHYLAKGVGNLVGGNSPKHQQARSGGYDFESHMRHLAQQTGIPLIVVKNGIATFELQYCGGTYTIVTVYRGQTINLGIFSSVAFPVGRIPSEVCRRLTVFATPSDGFQLSTIDVHDGSFVTADASGPTAGLAPSTFDEMVELMVKRLALLDAWILEAGYASR